MKRTIFFAMTLLLMGLNAMAQDANEEVIVLEDIAVNDILQQYIDAIGGSDKLNGVTTYSLTAEAEMQGMKLDLEMKKTSKNQFMQDVKVMGNSMSKQVLDGDKGFIVMQGQRQDLVAEDIRKIQEESATFPELNYLNTDGITLEGIETIDGKKTYKLKISDEKSSFYDMETGLKIQDALMVEAQGQQLSTTFTYGDYKEVDGIKFPFLLTQAMGPQSFDFIVKEIKVNEGVSDADFE
ncbi:MAG: hypothetical protein WBN18_03685 [Flavobacteriaceae bacterium]